MSTRSRVRRDVPPEVVDELGENRGNKIQENTKKRTRSHKGDEEKKPAAIKEKQLNGSGSDITEIG
jgi:hypothetical protein